jgi:hypothetical protein
LEKNELCSGCNHSIEYVTNRLKSIAKGNIEIAQRDNDSKVLLWLKFRIWWKSEKADVQVSFAVGFDCAIESVVFLGPNNTGFSLKEFSLKKYGRDCFLNSTQDKSLSPELIAKNYLDFIEKELVGVLNGEWWPDIPRLEPRDMGY